MWLFIGIFMFFASIALIPFATDAPMFHMPFATVVVIVLNLLAFGAATADPSIYEWAVLWLGDGINPVQWLTSIYMHMDLMHLVGNMMFLWAFGMVVEGKVGWVPFVIIYHAIESASLR